MNILVVDDDTELREMLRHNLGKQHYTVGCAENGEEALDKLADDTYDLVLLDIMLPGDNGLEVLRQIREMGLKTPVIMLTARGDVGDRVMGLDLGADDYLAKPFSMSELLARIRAILRRGTERVPFLEAGDVSLDTVSRAVRKSGEVIELTSKEFSILEFLLYNKGRAVSRFNLAEHVWGDDFDPFTMSNFIDVHIKNLRQKIQSPGTPSLIRTLRMIGYIIDAQ
ncbi:MAG: response regulator transcription factor [Desulfoarculaceae bacterium]|nr:response regulator transcription factor [Desulfoarculaceae bacterium]